MPKRYPNTVLLGNLRARTAGKTVRLASADASSGAEYVKNRVKLKTVLCAGRLLAWPRPRSRGRGLISTAGGAMLCGEDLPRASAKGSATQLAGPHQEWEFAETR